MPEPKFSDPAVEAIFDRFGWEYFGEDQKLPDDMVDHVPWTREEVEEQGFLHSTPTGTTNNFENLYEMAEDDQLVGRFAIFHVPNDGFWIGFESEASAVTFRLKK